jgi:hypothetical protein
MDGARFDRFARNVAKGVSRRGMLAALGGLALAGNQRARASQLTPSTCGAAGDVCTMLMGCCDGLTCVTSAINTNYGVCVTGEGGTVSVGTTLISPFSENVEQEVAALAASDTTSTTTTTTDPDAEREQRIADKKARKSSRRNEQQTRRSANQTEQKDRREDRRLERDARRGPRLSFEIFNHGGFNQSQEPAVETVRVTNRDDDDVTLHRIESLPPPGSFAEVLVGTSNGYVLDQGESFLFLSRDDNSFEGNRFEWIGEPICNGDDPGEGFLISASFGISFEEHHFTVSCSRSNSGNGNGSGKRKKRRRKQAGGKNRN